MNSWNIDKEAKENTNFRKVIHTGKHSQLVLMNIPKGGEIGEEVHPDTDQILFFLEGKGEAILNGESEMIGAGDAVFVEAGTTHNFINKGENDLKLYTIYAPPAHKDGTVHATREDAEKDEGDKPY